MKLMLVNNLGVEEELVKFMVKGGIDADGYGQEFSHSISFNIDQEGIYFLKKYSIRGKKYLMVAGDNPHIKYDIRSSLFSANARHLEFQNLRSEIFKIIEQCESCYYKVFKNNSFEDKQTIFTSLDTAIFFDLNNPQFQTLDTLKFDVYARTNVDSVFFHSCKLFFNYDTLTFGANVISNYKLFAKKKNIILSENYTLSLSDVNDSTFLLDIFPANIDSLTQISQYPAALTEFKILLDQIDISSIVGLGLNVSTHQSFYKNGITNEILPFSRVIAEDNIQPFIMPEITDFEGSFSGDEKLSAGTDEILIIEGKNFGPTEGIVRLGNADYWPPVVSDVNSLDVLWTDSEIQVRLPADNDHVARGPTIFIETFNNMKANSESLDDMNVRYAIVNRRNTDTNLSEIVYRGDNLTSGQGDDNNDGILRFTASTGSGITNTEINIIRNAICDWHHDTDVLMSLASNFSNSTDFVIDDGINLIFYGDDSYFNNGINDKDIAYTINELERCDANYIKGSTIILRKNLSSHPDPAINNCIWSYNQNPSSNEIDFYSVIMHELGHALGLRHAFTTCNSCSHVNKTVMFPNTLPGELGSDIHYNDEKGIKFIVDESDDNLGIENGGCSNSITTGDNCITSVNNEYYEGINLYPNPLRLNISNLKIESIHKIIRVEIFNNLGQLISSPKLTRNNTIYSCTINEILSPGYYNILIQTNEHKITKKFIINE